MTHPVLVRTDLPFVSLDSAGHQREWHPPRHAVQARGEARRCGEQCVDALVALAQHDEYEAYEALKEALLAREWNGYLGEEEGFADAIARSALIGWRAMALADEVPIETTFDPRREELASLRRKVENARNRRDE